VSGRIPREFIDELIARTDLVDLIDARVPLKKAGANYTARCPFHSEKSPSFTVSRDKQFYHCFGCGAHGNAIGFLVEYERQSFTEAVESLAELAGIPIPREASQDSQESGFQAIFAVQESAARFYAAQLRQPTDARFAVDYLRGRGVNGEIAKDFMLGYAPSGWRNLPDTLPPSDLSAAGLLIAKDSGGHYDRFRDRIMFPIRDRRGRVVGFGGRVLGDDTPKYLNSPETAVFKKHREVYGLFELLRSLRKPANILVVEGYMDVVALAQNGIANAVATLGTATSSEQADLLFRYTGELVFCFDGDRAGKNAAWKALEASLPALREGRALRFLMLPEGHDPDSLVRAEGAEAFARRMTEATPMSEYFFQTLAEGLNLNSIEGRAALSNSAKPLIERLPPSVFREMMENRLAELTGRGRVEFPGKPAKLRPSAPNSPTARTKPSPLRLVLALLIQNPRLFPLIDPESMDLLTSDEKAGPIAGTLLESLRANPGLTTGGVLEAFRETESTSQVSTLSVWDTEIVDDNIEQVFCDTLKSLTRKAREKCLNGLLQKAETMPLSPREREELRALISRK
jgi:DNA primase